MSTKRQGHASQSRVRPQPETVSQRALAPFAATLAAQATTTSPPRTGLQESASRVEPAVRDPRPAAAVAAEVLQITTFGCGALAEAEPHGLGLTYWVDAPEDGPSTQLNVRFIGRRVHPAGTPGADDTFVVDASVDPVLPGVGRIAVTAHALDLVPGEWQVTATASFGVAPGPVRRLPRGSAVGTTVFAPVVRVRAPGVRLGAWPAMVALGALVGVSTQAFLASHNGLPAARLLAISVAACLLGVIGAKVYYLLTHREEKRSLLTVGMSLQGFVLAAITTVVVGSIIGGLPLGEVLDVTAPGLLFGAAIGRLGCFFGGCCAGRPTASRWGLWSSNRSVGIRRIPVQLMDSAVAGTLGMAALVLIVIAGPSTSAGVFLTMIAAYMFGRQLLFPLRDLPRRTAHGRVVMLALTGAVVLAEVTLAGLVR
ncbi:MAG: diacylglyceryl transferase [Frankiales bacterium]|nr:diacylglyceryl transferase [Frankiales bacterium]